MFLVSHVVWFKSLKFNLKEQSCPNFHFFRADSIDSIYVPSNDNDDINAKNLGDANFEFVSSNSKLDCVKVFHEKRKIRVN